MFLTNKNNQYKNYITVLIISLILMISVSQSRKTNNVNNIITYQVL